MSIDPELLLTKGLFPENLPPVYTTKNIWPALSPDVATYSVTGKVVGDLCVYNASKRGGQRRLFGIPHPLFLKDQGFFFARHWEDLQPYSMQRQDPFLVQSSKLAEPVTSELLRIKNCQNCA